MFSVFLLDGAAPIAMVESLPRDVSGNWPRNVWAVDAEGYIYEAQLSNRGLGEYHGYPMKDGDRFAEYVRTEWERRSQ